jgi:hypothetical protein
MGEIIIGAIFGILLGICIFGIIDIEKQISKIDDSK